MGKTHLSANVSIFLWLLGGISFNVVMINFVEGRRFLGLT